MRQVEFLEPYKIGADTMQVGDRRSFEDAEAAVFINIGVAKCVATGEQGERKPGAHVIDVQGIEQTA